MGKEIDVVHFIQARRQLKKLYKLLSDKFDEETKKNFKLAKFTLLTLDELKDKNSVDETDHQENYMKNLQTHEMEAYDIFKTREKSSNKVVEEEKGHKNQVKPINFEDKKQQKPKK